MKRYVVKNEKNKRINKKNNVIIICFYWDFFIDY